MSHIAWRWKNHRPVATRPARGEYPARKQWEESHAR